MKKIAIQGIKGCFHHISFIKSFWGNYYEIVGCKNFNHIIQAIVNKETYLGIIAIDNIIVGNILFNYIFLSNYHLKILGAVAIYIEQQLLTSSEENYSGILSHPVALNQCNDFIYYNKNLKTIDYSDTALSSLYILKKKTLLDLSLLEEQR